MWDWYGSVYDTRLKTGVGVPQLSVCMSCSSSKWCRWSYSK